MKQISDWIRCPKCGGKIVPLLPTTKLTDFPGFCKYCKCQVIVNTESA